ncbi:MAG: DUF1800 domain-containing protein [Chloroflexota bacterium]|nr:DUF1800 domain-containing protein [Chloroflexota bacterium]
MAVLSPEVKQLTDLELMAHLFRRAGFGARREELEAALEKGYEATVEELLHPEAQPELDHDLIYRYYVDMKEHRQIEPSQAYWVYRMINTKKPLEEKMALFWHGLFATGFAKLNHPGAMLQQIATFRKNCLSDFRTILLDLSRDPAMIFWLDNQENTNSVHNENYGRELLELFSMGIGNYTEDDVKNCARAFTGWTLKNPIPGAQPFGRFEWEFEFRPDLHDYGEKEFLGERGNFDGADIIDIIVRQPATAQFVARRLYLFFVSDTPDQEAIDQLADVYLRSQYDIRAVMRTLFMSDFFRSRGAYYAKVKSPAEHVVGVMRLVEDFTYPKWGIREIAAECRYMGQDLLNPPSVEGWHTGKEWIDTGILVERVNFASAQVGDIDKPGVRKIVERLRERGELSPEQLVDGCLDLIGPLEASDTTRSALVTFANKSGPLRLAEGDRDAEQRVGEMLQMIVATREFQRV